MLHKLYRVLVFSACFGLFYSVHSLAEVHQWLDSAGRPQFSDKPQGESGSLGYVQTGKTKLPSQGGQSQSPKDLENIANAFKKDRLKREKIRADKAKARVDKNKKREKQLALLKKKEKSCQKARTKEDLAFRKRTQRQGLVKMRKALANYEKKRESRRKLCK